MNLFVKRALWGTLLLGLGASALAWTPRPPRDDAASAPSHEHTRAAATATPPAPGAASGATDMATAMPSMAATRARGSSASSWDEVPWLSDQSPAARPAGSGGHGGMPGMGSMAAPAAGGASAASAPARSASAGGMSGMSGMGGMSGDDMAMMGMGDGRTPPTRRLWLVQGGRAVAVQGQASLTDAQGARQPLAPAAASSPRDAALSFPMPEPGYYVTELLQQAVVGETLQVTVARQVAKRPNGHGAHGNAVPPPEQARADLPIQLIRRPLEDEGLHTQITDGTPLVFQVLRQGQPAADARVTLVSGDGWRKTVTTDAQGEARFTLVRDYFPDWRDFQRRYRARWIATAVLQDDLGGLFESRAYSKVRYASSLSESYYPAPSDYQSYAWGLGLVLAMLTLGGTAVWVYRRRRLKPYREERFHG